MKKKWIVAFIAAGVLLLGGVTVYAVKTSSQSTVKVVSVSDMSGGGGWSDNSLSGNITSDEKTGKIGNRTEHRESKKRNYKIKEYKTVQ